MISPLESISLLLKYNVKFIRQNLQNYNYKNNEFIVFYLMKVLHLTVILC